MITNMFSKIGSNDLASLKQYFDSGDSKIDNYTNAVEYTYDVSPQIYSSNTKTYDRYIRIIPSHLWDLDLPPAATV